MTPVRLIPKLKNLLILMSCSQEMRDIIVVSIRCNWIFFNLLSIQFKFWAQTIPYSWVSSKSLEPFLRNARYCNDFPYIKKVDIRIKINFPDLGNYSDCFLNSNYLFSWSFIKIIKTIFDKYNSLLKNKFS